MHAATNMDTNEEQQLLDINERDVNTIVQRRGRGKTIGISVEKKRRGVARLDVIIHPLRNRIVGDNAKDFKTEAGVLLKQHVPVQYQQWKQIPNDIKTKLWLGMKVYCN